VSAASDATRWRCGGIDVIGGHSPERERPLGGYAVLGTPPAGTPPAGADLRQIGDAKADTLR
jgi:hypothetical protein